VDAAINNNEEIFFAALEHEDRETRASFLAQACGDPELRQQVERLLARDASAGNFLQHPANGPTIATPDTRIESAGTTIGPYKLLEQIGDGGMGVVYVAEQTRPVRRKVALKIIKPGMDTKQVVARFEAERQALAMMDHPNIARVHDGGATESGRPYFVMELVRGVPITDYCDREQLSISQRLDLFVLVCRAVQHAHQKGIIHRDLKPSNILVTVIDGAAVPKIIDFGVAKATGAALTDRTVHTAFHQFIGTPPYMSPEQADLSGVDVDTRSDIYSLGVLLYELLTGTTPFDQDTLRAAPFDDVRRIIREQEPPKPSTRLSTLGEADTILSAKRGADARGLRRAVRGELDWIVMKALEKDRRRRYETANDLAADLMRHLTGRPVEACSPSTWYRCRKFARRNRASLTSAGLVALALIAGTAISVWQASRARTAADDARLRADESQQVVDFLAKDVFGATAHGKGRGRSVTLGELLNQADATIATRFPRQPLVEASVRMTLSRSYFWTGDQTRSARHAARAAELRARHLGPEHPDTLEALAEQAWDLCQNGWANGKLDDMAEPIARRAFGARRRVLGPAHRDTLWSQAVLAMTISHLGRHEEAEMLAAPAEQLAVRNLGPEHEATLFAQDLLGMIAERRGDFARADMLFRHSLAARERTLDSLDILTIHTLAALSRNLLNQGRRAEARPLLRETVDRCCRAFGVCHVQTEWQLDYLLPLLRSDEDYATTRLLCEQWLREILAAPADADPYQRERRCITLAKLSSALSAVPEEIPYDRELVARAAEKSGATMAIVLAYARLGRFDAAKERLAAEAARVADNPSALNDIAWLLVSTPIPQLRDPARATDLARKAVEKAPEAIYLNTLGAAYSRSGEPNLAKAALQKAMDQAGPDPEALNKLAWMLALPREPVVDPSWAVMLARKAVDLSPKSWRIWNTLGVAHYRAGEWDDAIAALGKAVELQNSGPAGTVDVPINLFPLAMAHVRLGEAAKARAFYDRAMRAWSRGDSDGIRAEAQSLLGVSRRSPQKTPGSEATGARLTH
jgi:serine/threonine protein kinase/tetratricopeptide (TPR) repeat protein